MKQQFTNNFDAVAPVYDWLGKMVFGRSQINAQVHQLKYIPANSRILIVGGGTGWILESIAKQYSSGLHIVYVEISEKMIKLAKARNVKNNQVEFVNSDIEDYQTGLKFDVVLTPFLFCNFRYDTVLKVFDKLDALLKANGLWFFTDFNAEGKGKWWKVFLTKSMYLFFKLFGVVEGNALIDMSLLFSRQKYRIEEERFYYGHYIQGIVYRKSSR